MKSAIRVLVTAIAAVATYYFVYWIPFSLILPRGPWGIRVLGSLLCAFAVARYVWRRTDSASRGSASSVLLGAVVLGGVGFVAGFFGPILFSPGANQGPMLGLFITGPLGVLVGAVGGGIYGRLRRRRMREGAMRT